jgi:hypothetical protein
MGHVEHMVKLRKKYITYIPVFWRTSEKDARFEVFAAVTMNNAVN